MGTFGPSLPPSTHGGPQAPHYKTGTLCTSYRLGRSQPTEGITVWSNASQLAKDTKVAHRLQELRGDVSPRHYPHGFATQGDLLAVNCRDTPTNSGQTRQSLPPGLPTNQQKRKRLQPRVSPSKTAKPVASSLLRCPKAPRGVPPRFGLENWSPTLVVGHGIVIVGTERKDTEIALRIRVSEPQLDPKTWGRGDVSAH